MHSWHRLADVARRQPHGDVAIALVVFAVTAVTTAASGTVPGPAFLLAAPAAAPLIIRRRWPLTAFVLAALGAEAYLAAFDGHQGAMVLAAPLIALYTVAETNDRRRALAIGVLAVLALAGLHMLIKPASWLGAENLALAAFGGLAVAAGDGARSRRAYLAEVTERARRAEAERDAEAARRVTDERLRIARDLHDVIGHQLALITVQAGVARHVLPSRPDQADQALDHIRAAGKAALDELRDTIGLLRTPGEDATSPTEPTLGLAALPALLDSFRRSGLDVRQDVAGRVRPMPATVDVTAYRVIQEALTNACRHAGRARVDVSLDYRPAALLITVVNPVSVPETGPVPDGHGLLGMRERVTSLAGTLRAGVDGRRYRVEATLPAASAG
jgi:signal transduction histidine kinase